MGAKVIGRLSRCLDLCQVTYRELCLLRGFFGQRGASDFWVLTKNGELQAWDKDGRIDGMTGQPVP